MKKLLFGLVATITFGLMGNAQINEDPEFKLYLKNQFEFIKKNNFSDDLKIIFSDSKVDESEMQLFYRAFSTNDKNYFDYLTTQTNLIKSLEEKYALGNLSELELSNIFLPEIEKLYNLENLANRYASCKSKFYRDIAAATATAYLGHLGCISFDLTVFAGIACHSAVAIIQYTANETAHDNYIECMGGR